MKKIFVHCRLREKELKELRKNFLLRIHSSKNIILNENDFFKKAAGSHGILSQGNIINKNFIHANKNSLRAISNVGVGYDNIDIDAATRNGVAVFNTPNLMNNAVADLTMGLMISLVRKICVGNEFVKSGKWKGNSWDLFWGENLYSESIGIIGLGNIGKEVAKRAVSFGLKVFYNNRKRLSENIEKQYKVSYLDFKELIANCKFIVLLLPLTKKSKHLFTKRIFQKMRDDSFLINVARGKIIKEVDLVDALVKKKIAGAALDVFENEPKIERKLLGLKTVVLMPHAGSATDVARLAMMKLACNNLTNYLIKGELNNLVNKDLR